MSRFAGNLMGNPGRRRERRRRSRNGRTVSAAAAPPTAVTPASHGTTYFQSRSIRRTTKTRPSSGGMSVRSAWPCVNCEPAKSQTGGHMRSPMQLARKQCCNIACVRRAECIARRSRRVVSAEAWAQSFESSLRECCVSFSWASEFES